MLFVEPLIPKIPYTTHFVIILQIYFFPVHKDPYENIYCVVRGHKDIILQPPTDLPWIPYKELTPGVYKRSEDEWIRDIDPESDKISWIVIDPNNPDLDKYPEYGKSSVYRLRLEQVQS